MGYVVLALVPSALMGVYNTGHQANAAMARLGVDAAPGWRGALLGPLGVAYDAASVWDSAWHGLLYFAPVLLTAFLVGEAWTRVFAAVRERPRSDGVLVTSLLFTMSLPASIPLWQVALGISFGIVVGKEIFGGTGKNFLNPALAGLALLYFAYPTEMSGDAVWTPVDGFSGATGLSLAAAGGLPAIERAGIAWSESFLGRIPGAMGETSTLACLLGAAFLIHTRVASWRIMTAVVGGAVATSLVFDVLGAGAAPPSQLPWHWHLTLGSFALGAVFFATDPVTSAMTDAGRWIYGALIGFMIVLIRIANPSHPEGVMLAILLGNIFAPLIDYAVMRANIRRRARRGG
jgi:Na+-transporting NADH:ubiquinone oxidoreductase subunit B